QPGLLVNVCERVFVESADEAPALDGEPVGAVVDEPDAPEVGVDDLRRGGVDLLRTVCRDRDVVHAGVALPVLHDKIRVLLAGGQVDRDGARNGEVDDQDLDRKSTRLNSSHANIS